MTTFQMYFLSNPRKSAFADARWTLRKGGGEWIFRGCWARPSTGERSSQLGIRNGHREQSFGTPHLRRLDGSSALCAGSKHFTHQVANFANAGSAFPPVGQRGTVLRVP